MKKIKLFGIALMAVLLGLNFTACSSSDDDNDNNGGQPGASEKKLVSATEAGGDDTGNYTYTYDKDGQLIKYTYNEGDANESESFEWTGTSIIENVTKKYGNGPSSNYKYTYTLVNGKVVKSDYETFDYENNKISYYSDGSSGYNNKFTWDGDKLVTIQQGASQGDYYTTKTLTYSGKTTKGYIPFTMLSLMLFGGPLIEAHPGLFGIATNQLPDKATDTYANGVHFITSFTYEFTDGYVTKITQIENDDNDKTVLTLKWE